MERIMASNDNKVVRLLKKLKYKKYRDREAMFVAEGVRLVKEALLYADVSFLLLNEDFNEDVIGDFCCDVPCYRCNSRVFGGMSDTVNSQGIIAVCRKPSAAEYKKELGRVVLILDGISDPGNMGTILRSAEAFGVKSVVVCPQCIEIYNPKVVRSSMGSVFRLNILGGDIIADMKNDDYTFVSAAAESSPYSSKNIYDCLFDYDRIAVVIGSEAHGVRTELQAFADLNVFIPMCSPVESLNAAIAASVILFEINRKNIVN